MMQRKMSETISHGIRTDKYINPETITTRINDKLRDEKVQDSELWQQLLAKAKYDNPSASDNRL